MRAGLEEVGQSFAKKKALGWWLKAGMIYPKMNIHLKLSIGIGLKLCGRGIFVLD
jgi:hypothetical protein